MEKVNGYYWVKYKGTSGDTDFWIVAEWNNHYGWDGGDIDDDDIVDILWTRLISPDEKH